MALDETIVGGQAGHQTDHEALHTRYNRAVAVGELWFSTPAATTIGVAGTFYKAAGTTTLETSPAAADFTHTDNRLTYTGTDTRKFWVSFTFSAKCGGTNQLLGFALAENGTHSVKTLIQRQVSTGADEGAGAVHGLLELATNDYVEVFVTNNTSTNTVTIQHGNLSIVAIT